MTTYSIDRRINNRVPADSLNNDALGLRTIADALIQRGRLALTVFGLVFGATLAYWLLGAPVYTADTLLQIDSHSRAPLLPNAPGAERSGTEGERLAVTGEIEILRSREVLLPVILAHGADVQVGGARRYGYVPIGAQHGVDVAVFHVPERHREVDYRLRVHGSRWTLEDDNKNRLTEGKVGELTTFAMPGGDATIKVQAAEGLPATELKVRPRHELKAYEDVLKRLRVFEPSRDSNLVRIVYEDRDPQRVAALLNAMVNRYVTRSVQRRADDDGKALAYLQQQLLPLKKQVEAAEDALTAEQNMTRATPTAIEADALLRQRGDLERQLMELRIKRDLMTQTFTAEHPGLAAVIKQISTVQSAMSQLGSSVKQLPLQQRDMVRLQRNVQVSTDLYVSMLARVQQLKLNGASGLSTTRQLDPAAVPAEPARPRAMALLSIGAGAGLLLALAAVMLARALNPTVSDAREHALPNNLPTLAVIQHSDAQQRLMAGRLNRTANVEELGTHRLLVHAAPDDPAVESLRAMHQALSSRARTLDAKVMLITAPTSGTGKSFVASNLAALMAENGKRVLLLEGDLRHPGIHRFVGMDKYAPGLVDVLTHQHSLDRIVNIHPSVPIEVILRGSVSTASSGVLTTSALDKVMVELRRRYDHIVINASPVLTSSGALALGRLADMAVMVVHAEKSLMTDTRAAQQRLERAGIIVEGLLFNEARPNRLNPTAAT